MQPFRKHTGKVAPLYRANVDTDQIIPKQFLKRIERTGFGEFLFNDWRRTGDGTPDPKFVLNDPRYAGLADFGLRAVIAPSFADIFANNCVKNGVLTVVLGEEEVSEIARKASEISGYEIAVDLENCAVRDQQGLNTHFQIDEFTRHCLLEGLDDIGLTLQHAADITAYEAKHPIPSAWKS